MEKKDLRIVFMGTPEFAVESLKSLVEGGYNVVSVVIISSCGIESIFPSDAISRSMVSTAISAPKCISPS